MVAKKVEAKQEGNNVQYGQEILSPALAGLRGVLLIVTLADMIRPNTTNVQLSQGGLLAPTALSIELGDVFMMFTLVGVERLLIKPRPDGPVARTDRRLYLSPVQHHVVLSQASRRHVWNCGGLARL